MLSGPVLPDGFIEWVVLRVVSLVHLELVGSHLLFGNCVLEDSSLFLGSSQHVASTNAGWFTRPQRQRALRGSRS